MAVSTTNAVSGPYAANGVTTVFPFSFKAMTPAEVIVTLTIAGAEVEVSTSDFSVELNAVSGGAISFETAPVAGDVYVYSDPLFTQEAAFASKQPFSPTAVNDALDRAAVRDQAIQRKIDAAIDAIDAGVFGDLRSGLASTAPSKGASLINTESGQSVQTSLKYVRSSAFVVSIGYDSVSGTASAVKIGANDATRGRGALQIGGAGKMDGPDGAYLFNDTNASFNVVQCTKTFAPTEWNIYGNNTGGIATSTGTTALTLVQGTWSSFLVGRTIYFRGSPFVVDAINGDNTVLTLASAPPAGTGAWNIAIAQGAGTCSVSGSTLTRISGDPFLYFPGTGFVFLLNGATVTVSSVVDTDTLTLSAPPGNTSSTPYSFTMNINDQISTTRIQKVAGASEENLAIFARPDGYWVVPAAAGSGELYPLWITSNYERVFEANALGKFISLGGVADAEASRFLFNSVGGGAVNRTEFQGGATGQSPVIQARGADTNVGLGIDTKGTGRVDFTSGSYGRNNFRIYGSNGADFLSVDAVTGAPVIAAEGASANIDILLAPKGSGLVKFGTWTSNGDALITGYVTIKDLATGTIRKLATIGDP